MAPHRETSVSSVSRRKSNTNSRSHSQDEDKTTSESHGNFKRHLETKTLAAILAIVIFFGSILHENDVVPDSYFSNKRNPFNQTFVKWAWGWTLCILTPYLLLLSWARARGPLPLALRGILRLVVLTATWYFWVEIVLHTVHEWTGKCSVGTHGDSRSCRRGGGRWEGFDISGHSFLLVLIALVTHEELGPLWQLFEATDGKTDHPNSKPAANETPQAQPGFPLKIMLYFFAIIISLLQSLSVLMVIATSLYFHVMSHKILGTAIALLSWFATYRLWFTANIPFALPL